ncbi:hypothetical protein AX14_009442 [Amanita brunnescens Koide BX004]|nr:hypothetical protein AX14_009442 [Amanita brunnescens Koide BX004]
MHRYRSRFDVAQTTDENCDSSRIRDTSTTANPAPPKDFVCYSAIRSTTWIREYLTIQIEQGSSELRMEDAVAVASSQRASATQQDECADIFEEQCSSFAMPRLFIVAGTRAGYAKDMDRSGYNHS